MSHVTIPRLPLGWFNKGQVGPIPAASWLKYLGCGWLVLDCLPQSVPVVLCLLLIHLSLAVLLEMVPLFSVMKDILKQEK